MRISNSLSQLGARFAVPLLAAGILVSAGAQTWGVTQTNQAAPTPQDVGVPPGPAPALSILFTSQVTGWTEPCG